MARQTTVVLFVTFFSAAAVARAQEPPPPTPVVTPPSADAVIPVARAPLTEVESRRRREMIFLMEGMFMNAVSLAANETAREIQTLQPGITMFTSARPRAHGNHLDDYGVFFHIEIPSVRPAVVSMLETLGRSQQLTQNSNAQPAMAEARRSREALMDPDAHYVESVRQKLTDAMLETSKSLDLRPHEWLTVSARGADDAPGTVSQPSVMILRVKGSDIIDYLAGRISREEVRKRVQVQGF